MSCCSGKGDHSTASRYIDAALRRDKEASDAIVKLLLLGTGESGKSTIVKQMKILNQKGFTRQEIQNYTEVVYGNVLQSIKALYGAMDRFGVRYESDAHHQTGTQLNEIAPQDGLSIAHKQMIKDFWSDTGVKAIFIRSDEYWLPDSTEYFMSDLERLFSDGYLPTEQDVLRTRTRTTGIVETEFSHQEMRCRLFDVGGQRNERKKWIHCFQDVTAVIFVVGISEYDQHLFEEDTINRMKESLVLWDEICNSRWFSDTSMILFLNKTDIFRHKLIDLNKPLSNTFPDYTGGPNYELATKFIEEQFLKVNKAETKMIYVHQTQATDTKNIDHVFSAVKDTILSTNLRSSGFIA